MVKGGAIVCRMGARIRRGEELAVTRTLAEIGVPILRTVSGTALMEGGSFAWINRRRRHRLRRPGEPRGRGTGGRSAEAPGRGADGGRPGGL